MKKQTAIKPQYIYLIQKNTEAIYKIGISDNPSKRVKQLQTGNSARLHLIKVFPVDNARATEKRLHRLLMFHRCSPNGEWFKLTPEHVELVTEICSC
jgi:predicted GIY-YIG superfamily endonuclease